MRYSLLSIALLRGRSGNPYFYCNIVHDILGRRPWMMDSARVVMIVSQSVYAPKATTSHAQSLVERVHARVRAW